MHGTREAAMVTLRRDENGTPTVWCDPGIEDLVDALNNGDLATIASCSGHGYRPGWIALKDGRQLLVANSLEEMQAINKALPYPDINGNMKGAIPAPRNSRQ